MGCFDANFAANSQEFIVEDTGLKASSVLLDLEQNTSPPAGPIRNSLDAPIMKLDQLAIKFNRNRQAHNGPPAIRTSRNVLFNYGGHRACFKENQGKMG